MDISKWTDAQLIQHGWTPEQIQYQRALESQTPSHLQVSTPSPPIPILETNYSPATETYYDEIQKRIHARTPKRSKRFYLMALLVIAVLAGGYYLWF